MAFLLWLVMPGGYPFSSIGRVLDMNTRRPWLNVLFLHVLVAKTFSQIRQKVMDFTCFM